MESSAANRHAAADEAAAASGAPVLPAWLEEKLNGMKAAWRKGVPTLAFEVSAEEAAAYGRREKAQKDGVQAYAARVDAARDRVDVAPATAARLG